LHNYSHSLRFILCFCLTAPIAPPGSLLLLCLSCMTFLWKMKIKNRSISSLLAQYVAVKAVCWLGNRQRNRLEADTRDIQRVQQETLLKRLKKHSNTVHGKQYEFTSIRDTETFQQNHPITDYDHYEKFVERVAKGEQNVLISEKSQHTHIVTNVMRQAFPATGCLQKSSFTHLFFVRVRQVGPNSSTPASSKHMLHLYTTPAPIYQVLNERDALYLHLLFGLKDHYLGMLESNFSSTIFYAFRALQVLYSEQGSPIPINSGLNLKAEVCCALEKLMKPDPERAAELTAQFEKGFEGIAFRIWPQLHMVLTVDSGSNQIYGEMLRQHYCKGVPFYSPFYAANEGLIGVNLCPQQESRQYLLSPRSMFYNYELLVTNASGLFRYRIGDVVKVVGFHNQCPKVEFQYWYTFLLYHIIYFF
uniref:GH3 domain containing n=1 Tax=Cyprinus carpio TaxID=7962 RepID=A0A8C2C6X1_CYPCA